MWSRLRTRLRLRSRWPRRFRPHVALVDIGLPVLDGYELAQRFRADPDLGEIHLVAVTGYGQQSDRDRSAAAGFDAHLVKPVEIHAVASVVAGLDRSASALP